VWSHDPRPNASAAVAEHDVLLVHDVSLPSVTALLAGEPVRGSWWSHPRGTQIYDALQAVTDELATVKLLLGKQTLVTDLHWPVLVAIGSELAPWQLDALSDDAHAALAVVDRGRPTRRRRSAWPSACPSCSPPIVEAGPECAPCRVGPRREVRIIGSWRQVLNHREADIAPVLILLAVPSDTEGHAGLVVHRPRLRKWLQLGQLATAG
jgi:hypothetical protein